MRQNRFTPPIRRIGLPTTSDGLSPTITAVYETQWPANWISTAHFPKMSIGVVYETF